MMSDPSGDTTGYVLIFAICLFVVVVYKDRKLLYEEYFEDYPQGQRQYGSPNEEPHPINNPYLSVFLFYLR